ncbi:hypothetical protein DL768_007780 [Monosporascus sp. mg162]|nr:hypothetical protein DL768_007780 [Monosporascus sp. mg162]
MTPLCTATNEPIAVIGSGCRFPGGINTPSKLWDELKAPRDLQREIPKQRFNVDAFYHPEGTHQGRTNARHAYTVSGNIHAFDASFFNIQPHEAEAIDPQQRLLLETVYEGISSAGLKVEDLAGSSTAVYVGMMTHDFETNITLDLNDVPTHTATGISLCIAANRLSYFFDWHGPSMTLDTACSSSLVAVHLAVQQLRSGSSKVAVAAGANLILAPLPYVLESKLKMLSPTGRSRMWDADADGYARGEGVACVILKTLSQALYDGDQIECIIRETGVNQDGRTPGITMPSNSVQTELIRETYAKAGLDLSKPTDRCQFFEAHGTGTPAGDPQEAEAISTAFFGRRQRQSEEDPLYVGSVKTVIGHTEGTAGIAGLMKASLAVQHGIIPPNLLFENLSPRVEPFYKDLRIVKEAQNWPSLAPGQPRRASVNSFGFGGTNAHAIVESYRPDTVVHASKATGIDSEPLVSPLPLVISAKSERSLKAIMEDLVQFLKTTPDVQMQDVCSTLLQKLSVLNVRRAVTGVQTVEAARAALEKEIASIDAKGNLPIITSKVNSKPGFLGIFTGQGAQWPAMGKKLISRIPFARDIINELDESLQTLVTEYRPRWKLYCELMLEEGESNVKTAAISQPVCTAVQIMLCQLLAAAGVTFTAVVGHSSGEIACAYAAGFITASQAIRIAYLRGLAVKDAVSPTGSKGAMLAAGTSLRDAKELCQLEAYEGRVCVAASNSPESVTLSGDADAIEEIMEVLQDEAKFARLLKVDKAYHSHHMLPCSQHYLRAMEVCGYSVAEEASVSSTSSPVWYSSVHEGKRMTRSDASSEYWKDNLISEVLFSQAVGLAVSETAAQLDAVIEVGPHPALKGPAISTMEACAGLNPPYTGCMQRGEDDVNALARALGYLWERFGSDCLDIDGFNAKLSPQRQVKSLTKELPRYPWDHSRSYWAESRRTRAYLHADKPHLLLGKLSADSTPHSLQWTNFIRPRDIEWLDGHGLQGQTVFPGAGYVIMAMEAAIHIASGREVQLLEVLDLSIGKAITFDDENSLVELSLKADITSDAPVSDRVIFSFRIDSCLAKENALSSSATGQLVVTLGPASLFQGALPPAQVEPPHMNKVNLDTFYKELATIGYQYTKDFREILSMRRVDGRTTGTLGFPKCLDGNYLLLLHPATLDLSFQTVICAYSSPGDKRLRSLHVPTHIRRIAIVPSLCAALYGQGLDQVHFNSFMRSSTSEAIGGDIEVFTPDNSTAGSERATIFQVEGIIFKPFTPPSAADDHLMFSKWVWGHLNPQELLDDERYWATEDDKLVIPVMERIVYFYIRTFLQQLTQEDKLCASPHYQLQIGWFEHILAETKQGRLHAWYDSSWEADTQTDITQMCTQNSNHPHVRLIQRIGQKLTDIMIYGTRNAFELMDHDGLLTDFYTNPRSFGPSLNYFQDFISQITHRYQNMDILEIGAGTGGATKYVLSTPQIAFNSYTYTDISLGLLNKARETFSAHEERMEFRALDVRRSPEKQGFKPHTYDLVLASNVLHATPKLEETMMNVRSLLKPGGHLVVLELTHREHSRLGFIFGLFPDWWAGVDEGRKLEPFVSFDQWDDILKRTGFSGLDARTLDRDATLFPNSCFSTHAVNAKISKLDTPLSAPLEDLYSPLVVIGGGSPGTKAIVEGLQKVLPHRHLSVIKKLQDIHESDLGPKSTFLVLSELDDALFAGLDEDKFEALKTIFYYAARVLLVTEDAWVKHPYQAMTIGLFRSVRLEHADVATQVIDVDCVDGLDVKFLAQQVLRLEYGSNWQEDGLVWTQEPEIYLSQGRVLVPRLKHDVARNNRLNSTRRPILVDVNVDESPVSLRQNQAGAYLELSSSEAQPSFVDVRVHYALPKSIHVNSMGYLYLVQGTDVKSDEVVVALSKTNASTVSVPSSRVFALASSVAIDDQCVLHSVAAELLSHQILSGVASGTAVLVLEPPSFCVEALHRRAKSIGAVIKFASVTPARPETDEKIRWIRLHPKETDRGLVAKVTPFDLSAFYDFSADQNPVGLGQRLAGILPSTCLTYRLESLVQDQVTDTVSVQDTKDQTNYVEQAVAAAAPTAVSAISADKITTLKRPWDISTVVDWKASHTLAARITPIDTGKLYVSTKTYLLVGLAGDLGRSLARWMINHGARHIVLSSRNPQIDERWLRETQKMGGNVLVLPMNISNESSVDAGLAKISAVGMPAIGGVAFGPLVLQDILFENMDLEMMEMVLAPKMMGARILDQKLAEAPLDFFVMFSSIVMVLGNPGQSAYSAANAYMHALAQQRRARGLAGSTIDIGAVYGVGYVTRAGREEEFDAVRYLFDTVSEDELHALFAEASVVGQPEVSQGEDIEVITGMPFIDPVHRERIPFFDDPRLGYYKLKDQKANANDSTGSKRNIKEQLLKAASIEEVREIITDGLSEKMRSTLQIAAEDSVDVTTALIDQGVDSLGAVTIGTWFSKQLNLDLPLLKVLGGASIKDLAEEAAERLPSSAIPLVSDDDTSSGVHSSSNVPAGSPEAQSGVETPLTEQDDWVDEPMSSVLVRQEHLSLVQSYSWTTQKRTDDVTIFNSTIGMFMEGPIDMQRLSRAANTLLRRHDIFRTRFENVDGRPTQTVMSLPSPSNQFQAVPVANRAAAEYGFSQLEHHKYDPPAGDTIKLVDYYWSPTEHLLALGYNRFVGDGQTTENLFNEIGQLYAGVQLPPPAQQYPDFAVRQLKDYQEGRMDEDIAFWTSLHKDPAPVLPVLDLPKAQPRGTSAVAWEQHTISVRLNPMIAIRVKERSRKHKASPMHFYLSAFHVLLARLTGSADVTVGVADMGRHNLQDIATMGYFANMLPVRMTYSATDTFGEELVATKEHIRAALQHSQVPYSVILEHLGHLTQQGEPHHGQRAAPLFQALFDYRQGQAESGTIGGAKITEVQASRERTPFDVVLEMSDDPTKTPLITFKLQSSLYGPEGTHVIANAYLAVLSIFSRNPALRVDEGRLDQPVKGVVA